jgi:hypothetical protein
MILRPPPAESGSWGRHASMSLHGHTSMLCVLLGPWTDSNSCALQLLLSCCWFC